MRWRLLQPNKTLKEATKGCTEDEASGIGIFGIAARIRYHLEGCLEAVRMINMSLPRLAAKNGLEHKAPAPTARLQEAAGGL